MENNSQQIQPTTASDTSNTPHQIIPQSSTQKNKEITPLHIVILLFIITAVILLIIAIIQIFRSNPYGEQIKINNINQYYKDFPTNIKDSVLNTLYNIASNNNPDTKMPKSGAKIREGSTNGSYNKNTNIYTDSFIVDIEELQQSYVFQVSWSSNENNQYLKNISYPVLASCPAAEQLIYAPFNCIDGSSNNGVYGDPIISILPINVSYYENNYAVYVAYSIISQVKDNKLTVIINDETGGNHDAALNKLKEAGINPDNYTIIYNDLSAEQIPARAPNDAT